MGGRLQDDVNSWGADMNRQSKACGTREEDQNWDGCKCKTCGKTCDEGHTWGPAETAKVACTFGNDTFESTVTRRQCSRCGEIMVDDSSVQCFDWRFI